MWAEQKHLYIRERLKSSDDARPHVVPVEAPVVAAQCRDSNRVDSEASDVLDKGV